MTLPGYRLRTIAARWCSGRTMERLVDPVIADLQAEYADARRAGRIWRSRWIWIAGHAAFAKAMAWHGAERAVGSVHDLTAEDRRALIRTSAIGLAMMVGVTVLLALLPFVSLIAGTFSERVRLTLYAVPQLLPTAIWVGVTYGILWGLESVSVSRRSRRLVLLLALALSVVTFTLLGWIVPARNQAFRVAVATTLGVEEPVRSANELTLTELGRLLEPGTHEPMLLAPPHNVRSLERSYYTRWAYSCAPLVLGLIALTLSSSRSRWVERAPGFVASALVLGYIGLWYGAQFLTLDRRVPIFAAVWIPNAVFLGLWLAQVRRGTAARLQAR